MSSVDKELSRSDAYRRCCVTGVTNALDEYDQNESSYTWTYDQCIGYLDGISAYLSDKLEELVKEKEEIERLTDVIRIERDRCETEEQEAYDEE